MLTDTNSAGFAHTPEGALIAAVHIIRRLTTIAGDENRIRYIEEHYLPGDNRDFLVQRFTGPGYASSAPGVPQPLVGYVYRSYTEDEAVVDLVVANTGPGSGTVPFIAVTYTLLWNNGDWRMEAPPGGLLTSNMTTPETPMTRWSDQ
ncbi:hypothetical protein [Actinoplanes couchii]|uniref:hypothetical protein n=1 Tax=Actinoplanes couchii TaxID=403638 RepID=UPI0019451DCA|nr:hypothetical protein [Actinoplanes couchii]MDR6322518.1 hypothetical protein [Actinoplanes couchii]